MSDIDTVINQLVTALLPKLNDTLPALIKDESLDPLARVVSGEEDGGKINLGICMATANMCYSIKHMTGLSSLTVNNLAVSDSSGTLESFSSTLTLDLALKSDLKADVSGKATAHCGFLSPT
ncbi:MAG: hypothetical protein MJK04_14285, partial [Psychrosphaera sp.]|nr:hypothetical protein [Psychrosphaera sp.]